MANNFSTLESIFQIMEPSDLHGAKKLASKADDVNFVKNVLDVMYNGGGKGALSSDNMIKKFDDLFTSKDESVTTEATNTFKKVFHIFSSTKKQPKIFDPSKNASVIAGVVKEKTTFRDITGVELTSPRVMSLITTDSPFLTPAVRDASRVEIFLNSIPSIHASRMVPLLEVEFAFNREFNSDKSVRDSFGLMRFLMGSQSPPAGSTNSKLVDARTILDPKNNNIKTTMGMEMFTAPQTLINAGPVERAGRYNDVIDPFRPFATLESFTVAVTPTVGLYSYKKGTLVIKLHDRSRLAEVADLIRPQVYQNAKSAPTVWVTYGWRYPYEPSESSANGSRTYSDFINKNMLVREAYGISNTQFSFDNVGQVVLTLELWTKGVAELRTIKITDEKDGFKDLRDKILATSEKIADLASKALGSRDGISKEIRAYQIIDAASHGGYPDMSEEDIKKSIKTLDDSLKKKSYDPKAAVSLIEELNKFYTSKDKKGMDTKSKVSKLASEIAAKKFAEVSTGHDPYLPSSLKDKLRLPKPAPPHPLSAVCDEYNKSLGKSEVPLFNKHLCSFGKLFSVFVTHAFDSMTSIDELQLFFHQFNDAAGQAAATNIAEFPIEMPVFFDQYRLLIEAKRSENLTLEEFLKLAIDAQLSDERSLAYGFKSFFEPYNAKSPSEKAGLKKGEEEKYENALAGIGTHRGPFAKPVIEIYVETTYSTTGEGGDLLQRFELQESGIEADKAAAAALNLNRIMRIHIFDRSNNPYRTQSIILKGNDTEGSGVRYREVKNDWASYMSVGKVDGTIVEKIPGAAVKDGKVITDTMIGPSPNTIKNLVSRMVPSIIYGVNSTMVYNATLASKQDALLTVAQFQTVSAKSGKARLGQPNGSGQNGLPLRIIPASMTMATMGCPLLSYGQFFFCDFNTGTTVDNIYSLTGLTHVISPGKFESSLTLTFGDAYGRYEGAPSVVDYVKKSLALTKDIESGAKKK